MKYTKRHFFFLTSLITPLLIIMSSKDFLFFRIANYILPPDNRHFQGTPKKNYTIFYVAFRKKRATIILEVFCFFLRSLTATYVNFHNIRIFAVSKEFPQKKERFIILSQKLFQFSFLYKTLRDLPLPSLKGLLRHNWLAGQMQKKETFNNNK